MFSANNSGALYIYGIWWIVLTTLKLQSPFICLTLLWRGMKSFYTWCCWVVFIVNKISLSERLTIRLCCMLQAYGVASQLTLRYVVFPYSKPFPLLYQKKTILWNRCTHNVNTHDIYTRWMEKSIYMLKG